MFVLAWDPHEGCDFASFQNEFQVECYPVSAFNCFKEPMVIGDGVLLCELHGSRVLCKRRGERHAANIILVEDGIFGVGHRTT